MARAKVFDEPMRDADRTRERARQRVDVEELGALDLDAIWPNLAALVLGAKADHQRTGKRPRLTAEIRPVSHPDSGFFVHFAAHGFFEALAWFHEARQRAVDAFGKMRRAGQQNLVAALHAHDDRRRQTRIGFDAAARAYARA